MFVLLHIYNQWQDCFYQLRFVNAHFKSVVLNLIGGTEPANFIGAFTEPFVIGKIKYDFFKT